jgi:hypothetical protein
MLRSLLVLSHKQLLQSHSTRILVEFLGAIHDQNLLSPSHMPHPRAKDDEDSLTQREAFVYWRRPSLFQPLCTLDNHSEQNQILFQSQAHPPPSCLAHRWSKDSRTLLSTLCGIQQHLGTEETENHSNHSRSHCFSSGKTAWEPYHKLCSASPE